MKFLLLTLLLSFNLMTMALASPSSVLKTRIVNDGQTLSIDINGVKNSRKVHYHQTFSVAGMSSLRKEWLIYRAFDSQDVALPFHEIAGLVLFAGGLLTTALALIIITLQDRKRVLANSAYARRTN